MTVGETGLHDTCPGCGATPADRAKRDDYLGLRECPHCGTQKCALCDPGDDVECISCEAET